MNRNIEINCELYYNASLMCKNITVLDGALTCNVNLYYHGIPTDGSTFHYDDYDTDTWVYYGKKIETYANIRAIKEHYESLGIDLNDLILEQLPSDEILNAIVLKRISRG